MSAARFSALPLPSPLLQALDSHGFTSPMPVQARALPDILAGRDVLVQAPTGSGKTVAFGLGMLARLGPSRKVQTLALCPTHELAEQVSTEIRRLARCTPNVKVLTLCGGVPFAPQRASLESGAHVVVGTPGRLEEHLRKGSLELDELAVLVIDEADRMLDMGFRPQLERVVQGAPRARQTLLFSATYPESISELSRAFQRDAVRIDVGTADAAPPAGSGGELARAVEQCFFRVPAPQRVAALAAWLLRQRPESTLVFSNTRLECERVAVELRALGWVAASIHGDLSQRERQHALRLFANRSCSVLTATDVAARGWHVPNLSAVVNLGLPRDPTVYLHRAGRTGRLNRPGSVASFVSDEDIHAFRALERAEGQPLAWGDPLSLATPMPAVPSPLFVTLLLNGGKSKKLRAGDILGALTAEGGISGADVGEIHIDESVAYVAVARSSAERALERLREGRVKGRRIQARRASLQLRAPVTPPSSAAGLRHEIQHRIPGVEIDGQ